MTPVERLQAAIEKLEELKGQSSQGPWVADIDVRGDCVLWGDRDKFLGNIQSDERSWPTQENREGKQAVFFDCDRNDALLMVTLHRTIDAQLEILRFAVKRLEAITTLTGLHLQAHEHEMALADAILGGDS